jgi:hypothetical protein
MGRPKRAAAAKAEAASPKKQAKGGLAVGDTIPDFELETDGEQMLKSSDMASVWQARPVAPPVALFLLHMHCLVLSDVLKAASRTQNALQCLPAAFAL